MDLRQSTAWNQRGRFLVAIASLVGLFWHERPWSRASRHAAHRFRAGRFNRSSSSGAWAAMARRSKRPPTVWTTTQTALRVATRAIGPLFRVQESEQSLDVAHNKRRSRTPHASRRRAAHPGAGDPPCGSGLIRGPTGLLRPPSRCAIHAIIGVPTADPATAPHCRPLRLATESDRPFSS